HFVDIERALTAPERALLARLLRYGAREPAASARVAGTEVIVVPRFGTISPWSSKASDIAHVCGLDAVRRIERGITYRLHSAQPLGPERLAALAPVLLD